MITPRLMQQALADRLAGVTPVIDPAQFIEPWAACWRALDNAQPGKGHEALFQALVNNPERDAIISSILNAQPGAAASYPTLQDLAPDLRPIEWVWPGGWIPRSMLTLLGAQPGAGKSVLALDLCNRIIQGTNFPDGAPIPNPGAPVIYVDAEAVPQIVNERAVNWQMDTSKLYLMLPPIDDMLDFGRQEDRDRLVEMTYTIRPELIIIDSLSSISSKGENAIEDVRSILGFLSGLAREFETGLVLIHHVRKRGQANGRQLPLFSEVSIDDFRGSGHIVAMARSVLGLWKVQTGPKPDDNGPRKLKVIKSNLCRLPEALGFDMLPLQPTGVTLQWGDAPQPWEEPTKLDECMAWLEDLLQKADEPLRPKEIVEAGKAEGFGRAMIYRAREVLKGQIESTGGRRNPKTLWQWDEDKDAQD